MNRKTIARSHFIFVKKSVPFHNKFKDTIKLARVYVQLAMEKSMML